MSLIVKYYYGLALANAIPADDLQSFVAYAKAHPGEVTYATVGAGRRRRSWRCNCRSSPALRSTAIPFRGGLGVVQELVAGRVDLYPSPTLAVISQYQAKQLKIIAATSPERLKSLPDVPTLKENGFDFVRFGWLGVCAGAGTPEPIIKTLNEHIRSYRRIGPGFRDLIENCRLDRRVLDAAGVCRDDQPKTAGRHGRRASRNLACQHARLKRALVRCRRGRIISAVALRVR